MGVKEVDMVMSLSKFFSKDYAYVEAEASQMVKLAQSYGVGVKLIIETGFLSDEQKLTAGKIAVNAGCEFIKTCTGFGPGQCYCARYCPAAGQFRQGYQGEGQRRHCVVGGFAGVYSNGLLAHSWAPQYD